MDVISLLSALAANLHAAKDFETAGAHLLAAMFEATAGALRQEHDLDPEHRVLRGVIHCRPEDGYRRLWSKQCEPVEADAPSDELPSATAWAWVARYHCPVSIDVDARMLRVFEGGPPRLIR